ncbi:MAG: hypothetical protein WCT18_00945 [Patescibacteria group bacterium]
MRQEPAFTKPDLLEIKHQQNNELLIRKEIEQALAKLAVPITKEDIPRHDRRGQILPSWDYPVMYQEYLAVAKMIDENKYEVDDKAREKFLDFYYKFQNYLRTVDFNSPEVETSEHLMGCFGIFSDQRFIDKDSSEGQAYRQKVLQLLEEISFNLPFEVYEKLKTDWSEFVEADLLGKLPACTLYYMIDVDFFRMADVLKNDKESSSLFDTTNKQLLLSRIADKFFKVDHQRYENEDEDLKNILRISGIDQAFINSDKGFIEKRDFFLKKQNVQAEISQERGGDCDRSVFETMVVPLLTNFATQEELQHLFYENFVYEVKQSCVFNPVLFSLGKVGKEVYDDPEFCEDAKKAYLSQIWRVARGFSSLNLRELAQEVQLPVAIVEESIDSELPGLIMEYRNKLKVFKDLSLATSAEFWQKKERKDLLVADYKKFMDSCKTASFVKLQDWADLKKAYGLQGEDFGESQLAINILNRKKHVVNIDGVKEFLLLKNSFGTSLEELKSIERFSTNINNEAMEALDSPLEITRRRLVELRELGFSEEQFLSPELAKKFYRRIGMIFFYLSNNPANVKEYLAFLHEFNVPDNEIMDAVFALARNLDFVRETARIVDVEFVPVESVKRYLQKDDFFAARDIAAMDSDAKKIFEAFIEKNKQELLHSADPAVSNNAKETLKKLYGVSENRVPLEFVGKLENYLHKKNSAEEFPQKELELLTILAEEFFPIFGDLLTDSRISSQNKEVIIDRFVRDETETNLFSAVTKKLIKENKEKLLEDRNCRDLQVLLSLEKIPSTVTRETAIKTANFGLNDFWQPEFTSVAEWSAEHPEVPAQQIFALVGFVESTDPNDPLMAKMLNLYKKIKGRETWNNKLAYFLINAFVAPKSFMSAYRAKLKEFSFGDDPVAVEKFEEVIKKFNFFAMIKRNMEDFYADSEDSYRRASGMDYEEYDDWVFQEMENLDEEVLTAINSVESLEQLHNNLQELYFKNIRSVFQNNNLSEEKLLAVNKNWDDDFEPIMTYLSQHSNLRDYVETMFENMDSSANWQTWRYDLNNPVVKNQIGHLSPEQLSAWKNNRAAELGETMVSQSSFDRPEKIQEIIFEATINHRHFIESEKNKNPGIQEYLERVFLSIKKDPTKKTEIIDSARKELTEDLGKFDKIINAGQTAKILEIINKRLPITAVLSFNAKTEKMISDLVDWLTPELGQKLLAEYNHLAEQNKTTKKKDQIPVSKILTAKMRDQILQKVAIVMAEGLSIKEDLAFLKKHNLSPENSDNVAIYFNKRKELTAIVDLLALSNLNNDLIASGRLTADGKKNKNELNTAITNLKKYFKGSAFEMDLQNIEQAITVSDDSDKKRRLAFLSTDDPQLLWQVGKYPIGNGSCQNYDQGSMAQALMGYVGDAHTRAVFMLDLDKLPEEYLAIIESDGLNNVLINKKIPAIDILKSVVGRTIVKLTTNNFIFIEPTYTVLNKSDNSLQNYVNSFVTMAYGTPMNLDLATGTGPTKITIPKSRNSEGQYEDGASGNGANGGMGIQIGNYSMKARILRGNKQLTAEEQKVISNMTRSL